MEATTQYNYASHWRMRTTARNHEIKHAWSTPVRSSYCCCCKRATVQCRGQSPYRASLISEDSGQVADHPRMSSAHWTNPLERTYVVSFDGVGSCSSLLLLLQRLATAPRQTLRSTRRSRRHLGLGVNGKQGEVVRRAFGGIDEWSRIYCHQQPVNNAAAAGIWRSSRPPSRRIRPATIRAPERAKAEATVSGITRMSVNVLANDVDARITVACRPRGEVETIASGIVCCQYKPVYVR